jgi:hypothetical protein
MSARFQGSNESSIFGGENASGAENSKELLRACLQAIHEVTRRYYYHISAEESAPGSLSYLLDISEENLLEIFNICGFYDNKKSAFLLRAFETWVAGSFELGTVEVTSFRKKIFIKIGTGQSPKKPAAQVADEIAPPTFRMQTTTEGQSSKDSLMLLFKKKSPPTEATATTSTPTTTSTTPTTTPTTPTTTTAAVTSPLRVPDSPVKLTQKLNITSPDKFNLMMELVCDMASPMRAPLYRELVKGRSFSVTAHNNQNRIYICVPQCSNEASAMAQNGRYHFVEEISNTLGAGAGKLVQGMNKGALWLCRIMAQSYKEEYAHSAGRAGISCITRMTPKAYRGNAYCCQIDEDKITKALGTSSSLVQATHHSKGERCGCLGWNSACQEDVCFVSNDLAEGQETVGKGHQESATRPIDRILG